MAKLYEAYCGNPECPELVGACEDRITDGIMEAREEGDLDAVILEHQEACDELRKAEAQLANGEGLNTEYVVKWAGDRKARAVARLSAIFDGMVTLDDFKHDRAASEGTVRAATRMQPSEFVKEPVCTVCGSEEFIDS